MRYTPIRCTPTEYGVRGTEYTPIRCMHIRCTLQACTS
jgi:hypothetical protein